MNLTSEEDRITSSGVTETRIVVLVDEAEERRSTKARVSSIPLLRQLQLPRCSFHIVRTTRATPAAMLQEWVDSSSPHTALLYPSESSTPLDFAYPSQEAVSTTLLPAQGGGGVSQPPPIHTLVVLDGSWRTVQQLLFHNPLLQPSHMRHVRLDVAATYTSYYQRCGLRQEPAANCVSTAEAIALALLRLEKPSNQVGHVILSAFRRFAEDLNGSSGRDCVTDVTGPVDGLVGDAGAAGAGRERKRRKLELELEGGGTAAATSGDDSQDAEREQHPRADQGHQGQGQPGGRGSSSVLLCSKGVKERHSLTKSQKRKCNRKKEKRRKK